MTKNLSRYILSYNILHNRFSALVMEHNFKCTKLSWSSTLYDIFSRFIHNYHTVCITASQNMKPLIVRKPFLMIISTNSSVICCQSNW